MKASDYLLTDIEILTISSCGLMDYYRQIAKAQFNKIKDNDDIYILVESPCKQCEGRGEVETGIGMFPCDACNQAGAVFKKLKDVI